FDYLMICRRLTGDDRATSAASRLLEFLALHLHPDLTAAAEAGICRNPYVGQIGFLLLDSHPSARAIIARMSTLADSAKRIRPYLDDDLRLCRWGILPVLAALLAGPPDLHHHRRVGRARGPSRRTLAERGSCAGSRRGGRSFCPSSRPD
ncbi:MAG: hypothetical protein ACM30D_03435, partial [Hyphomicrobiales bacterium]